MNKNLKSISLLSLLIVTSLILSACGAAATTVAPTNEVPAATDTLPATVAPSEAPTTVESTTPNCGTSPVVLNAYFETGFQLPFDLATEFSKQYPNVTLQYSTGPVLKPDQ